MNAPPDIKNASAEFVTGTSLLIINLAPANKIKAKEVKLTIKQKYMKIWRKFRKKFFIRQDLFHWDFKWSSLHFLKLFFNMSFQ